MKKWYQKLSHPWAKSAAGFTLVELVVVIAILGVLGGVGTLGYSQYITHAQKKADMNLVANIIRAVEVGNNSGAFVSDEVVQASANGVQFPVGIITLTKTPGADASAFNIGQVTKTTGICDVPSTTYNIISGEPIKMYKTYLGELKGENGTDSKWVSGIFNPVYEQVPREEVIVYQESDYQTIQYCATHSDPAAVAALTSATEDSKDFAYKNGLGVYAMTSRSGILDANGSLLSGLAVGHTHGVEMTSNTMVSGSSVEGGVLDACLQAAYGPDYAGEMVLKSDGWTDATMNLSFDATKTMLGTAKNLANILSLASQNADVRSEFGISANYGNGATVMAKFSEYVADHPDEFIADWQRVDKGEIGYGSSFGAFARAATGTGAREIYSAARMAYNSAFGEYVKQNHGDANGASHASYISTYYTETAFIPFVGTLGLPGTICLEAFTAENTGLHADVKGCTICKDLYTKYVEPNGASQDAVNDLVSMMTSMDELESTNPQAANQNAFYSYYNNYLNEFQSVFNSAKNEIQGKSAIVLMFYAEDGKITYDISPKSADPRQE